MRIILSRKGFDTASGGGASPILPDGRMLSLPIPYAGDENRYSDLWVDGRSLFEVMRDLGYTGYDERSSCHLDPDINRTLCERPVEWRGLFGQVDAALGHLENQGVTVGDLFVFWGRFQHTVETRHGLQFAGAAFHAVYGYLEVGRVIDASAGERIAWARRFPHFGVGRTGGRGHVYEARDRLMDTRLEGSGVLTYTDELRLSDPKSASVSVWKLPAAFHPAVGGRLSYHADAARWDDPVEGMTRLRTVGRGQEFVAVATPAMAAWARRLITANS
jgi:putative DNA base modification enzyme with NMAD domain